MSKIKEISNVIVSAMLIMSTMISTNAATKSNKVTTAGLNKTKVVMLVHEKYKLKSTNTKKATDFKSSKKNVAKVSKNGTVTALKSGKTTITAKIGNKKVKSVITVEAPHPSKGRVVLTLAKNKATVKFKNTTFKVKNWSSEDKNIATVDKNGKITGKSVGITSVVAVINKSKYAIIVEVVKDGSAIILK